MSKVHDSSSEIKETDIVFECPFCQKSLAIDYRAAGLTVPCSDCGKIVEVPIPEGMDLADLDSTEEDLRIRAIHLREALQDSQSRIRVLEGAVEELKTVRDRTELFATRLRSRVERVARELEIMTAATEQINTAVKKLSDALSEGDDIR